MVVVVIVSVPMVVVMMIMTIPIVQKFSFECKTYLQYVLTHGDHHGDHDHIPRDDRRDGHVHILHDGHHDVHNHGDHHDGRDHIRDGHRGGHDHTREFFHNLIFTKYHGSELCNFWRLCYDNSRLLS